MIRQKGQQPMPSLYQNVNWIQLDERKKQIHSRREVLALKSKMRENSIKDMNEAKQRGLKKALKLFESKNGSASRRNKELISNMRSARDNFSVRTHQNSASNVHKHLISARKEYMEKIEALYPAWKEEQIHKGVEEIAKLERQKQLTNQRRQVAKDAFEKEQQVRKLVDEKRADLAITQLLEHNEEMERTTRRNQLDTKQNEIEGVLLQEAQKAGKAAHDKIVHASVIERENEVGLVRNVLRKGTNYGGDGDTEDKYVLAGSKTHADVNGDDFGVPIDSALSQQASLAEKSRLHNEWLAQQLKLTAREGFSPGSRPLLPLPIPPTVTSTDAGTNLQPQFMQHENQFPRQDNLFGKTQTLSSDHRHPNSAKAAATATATEVGLKEATYPPESTDDHTNRVTFQSPMSTTLISPSSAKNANNPPTSPNRSVLYYFADSEDVCDQYSFSELATALGSITNGSNVGEGGIFDRDIVGGGFDSVATKKLILKNLVQGEGVEADFKSDLLGGLVFDILHSSSKSLLPLDYLQGTPKKISESLEKLHSSNNSTKSKRGIMMLYNSFRELLRNVSADTPTKFTCCFVVVGIDDEPRIVRKVNNLFIFIREQTASASENLSMSQNVSMNLNSSRVATPGKQLGDSIVSTGSPNASTSRFSAAMKSYEEFGEEQGLDANITGNLSKSGIVITEGDNDEDELESGGEGNDQSEDEFDF